MRGTRAAAKVCWGRVRAGSRCPTRRPVPQAGLDSPRERSPNASAWSFASRQFSNIFGAALLSLLLSTSFASAQLGVKSIQEALIWTGFYSGPIDGDLGKGSIEAIRAYQTSSGQTATGVLTALQTGSLMQRAHDLKVANGFSPLVDNNTGASMGFPFALAPKRVDERYGSNYLSNDNQIIIGVRHYNCSAGLESVYNRFKAALQFSKIDYDVRRPNWFAVAGSVSNKSYYFRYFSVPAGIDGLYTIYDNSLRDRVSPAIAMLSLTFQPSSGPLPHRAVTEPPLCDIPVQYEMLNAGVNMFQLVAQQNLPRPEQPSGRELTLNAETKPIYLDSTQELDASKLLLDSIEELISQSTGKRAQFFKYVVDKAKLDGFRSDMPMLRVVFPERVFFDTDKSEIKTEAAAVVGSVAQSLRKQNGKVALFVAGHTDSRGSEEYNLDLSIRRAESVARALVSTGVGSALIWRVGFGKAIPLRKNDSAQNMAYNRRVEFLIAQQPTIIAAWVKNTKSLCQGDAGICDEPRVDLNFRAAPVGQKTLDSIPLQVPARPLLGSSAKHPNERPPLPLVILTRPSLLELGNRTE